MGKEDTNITEAIIQLEITLQNIISFVDAETKKEVTIDLISDKANIFKVCEGYRQTVQSYAKVCSNVAMLSQIQIKLRQVKRVLVGGTVLPSLVNKFKNRIEKLLNDIDICRQSAIVIKDSYDARLRFYQSTQYLLGSVRYNEIKY